MRKTAGARPLTDEQRALAETCHPACYHYAGKWARSPADTDGLIEICIDALVRAARGYRPARGTKFITYAVRAMWNAVRTEYRRRHERAPRAPVVSLSTYRPTAADAGLYDPPASDGLAEEEERRHRLGLVYTALRHLPKRDREMVLMRTGGALLQEVADRFGVSKERARQVVKKALARLRRKCGVADE
jgi:RNA polymerase sigma factor (sigma-70 family)